MSVSLNLTTENIPSLQIYEFSFQSQRSSLSQSQTSGQKRSNLRRKEVCFFSFFVIISDQTVAVSVCKNIKLTERHYTQTHTRQGEGETVRGRMSDEYIKEK